MDKFENKFFPFKKGKEIINNNSKVNIQEKKYLNSNNISNLDFYLMKFKTRQYFINENGEKRRVSKQRKYNPDIIRKKLKLKFHKTIKNIINNRLKNANSQKLFDFLPQCFLINLTKKINSKYFELTYKELLSTDFTLELNKTSDYKNFDIDKKIF